MLVTWCGVGVSHGDAIRCRGIGVGDGRCHSSYIQVDDNGDTCVYDILNSVKKGILCTSTGHN